MPDAFLKRVIAQREAEQEATMTQSGRTLPGGRGGLDHESELPRAESQPDTVGEHCMDTLVGDLFSDIADVRCGRLSAGNAAAISTIASRIIAATKVQISYASARKERPDVPFLNRTKQ